MIFSSSCKKTKWIDKCQIASCWECILRAPQTQLCGHYPKGRGAVIVNPEDWGYVIGFN